MSRLLVDQTWPSITLCISARSGAAPAGVFLDSNFIALLQYMSALKFFNRNVTIFRDKLKRTIDP